MIINFPDKMTHMEIWYPRYSDKHQTGEMVALLACYKVDNASPVIIVEFTKAKHLMTQRFAIERDVANKFPIDTNGKIPCYKVPLIALKRWESGAEVREVALSLWED